jgi:hypothetical protein
MAVKNSSDKCRVNFCLPLRNLDCALLFCPQQSYIQVCAQKETLYLLVHHLVNVFG